jgi:uncharacterized protein YciI
MQFLVIGKDGKDEEALERRMTVREAHLTLGDHMEETGERWYGCVMLDDNGKMIGSMAVMDFPSEKKLQEWLDKEPYVVGKVWQTVEIYKCNVKRPWKFNRPQSFYEERMKKDKK